MLGKSLNALTQPSLGHDSIQSFGANSVEVDCVSVWVILLCLRLVYSRSAVGSMIFDALPSSRLCWTLENVSQNNILLLWVVVTLTSDDNEIHNHHSGVSSRRPNYKSVLFLKLTFENTENVWNWKHLGHNKTSDWNPQSCVSWKLSLHIWTW